MALPLAYPLSIIYERSLSTGILPEMWKKSVVVPIHKKHSKDVVKNYRPISLTCVSCRVLESLIVSKIRSHLWNSNIIAPNQFGFINNRNTVSQLLEFQKCLIEEIGSGRNVDVIYLDIEKAFDSVSHRRLVSVLSAYGLKNNLLNWITSFLYDRKQQVLIGNSLSSWTKVISGVPQGSCLGPILFLIYINDSQYILQHSNSLLFADDCKLFLSSRVSNYRDLLQRDLYRIDE